MFSDSPHLFLYQPWYRGKIMWWCNVFLSFKNAFALLKRLFFESENTKRIYFLCTDTSISHFNATNGAFKVKKIRHHFFLTFLIIFKIKCVSLRNAFTSVASFADAIRRVVKVAGRALLVGWSARRKKKNWKEWESRSSSLAGGSRFGRRRRRQGSRLVRPAGQTAG